jgi:hypothetical protein
MLKAECSFCQQLCNECGNVVSDYCNKEFVKSHCSDKHWILEAWFYPLVTVNSMIKLVWSCILSKNEHVV